MVTGPTDRQRAGEDADAGGSGEGPGRAETWSKRPGKRDPQGRLEQDKGGKTVGGLTPLLGLTLLGVAEEVISRNRWAAGSHFQGREKEMCAAGRGFGRAEGNASRLESFNEALNLAEPASTWHRAQKGPTQAAEP